MDPLQESLVETAEHFGMFRQGDRVLVAVSGGQDSLALLHALTRSADRWGLTLFAAHFDHGLRGEDSLEDARAVEETCREWSVPFITDRGDVASAAKRLHRSRQVIARELRLGFLERAATKVQATRIALGHTLDDRLETVLLNVVRGSGVDGLSGIAAVSGNRIRPLITVTRAETAAYCERHAIPIREDASNLSPRYLRNRIRLELLPLLEERYNPRMREALHRLSDLASDDSELLRETVEHKFASIVSIKSSGEVELPLTALRSERRAMQRRLIRLGIERVRGGLRDIEFGAVESVIEWLEGEAPGRRFQLTLPPGDIRIVREKDALIVRRIEAPTSALPVKVPLMVPGVTRVPQWGLSVTIEPGGLDEAPASGLVAHIDTKAIKGTLVIRSRRPGDLLQPLGMSGTRKLQDILTDRKVPRQMRDQVPIIADDEGILWVGGHVLAERARVHAETECVYRLEIVHESVSFRDPQT